MAIRVPRTSPQPGPQTQQSGLSAVVPVQDIGGAPAAAARAGRQLTGLAAEIYAEERDRDVVTRVQELDIERRKADRQIVGDYLQLQGKAAVEKRAEAMAAIVGQSKSMKAGIKDRAVAEHWARQDAALTNAAMNQIDGHYRQQRTVWQRQTLQSRATVLSQDLARVAFGEGFAPGSGRLSDEAERARAALHDTINQLGELDGLPADAVQLMRQQADTAAIGGVVEQLVQQGRSSEARQMLAARRGDLEPDGARRLDDLVRRAGVDDESQRLATSTMQQALQAQRQAAVEKSKTGQPASLRLDFAAAFTAGRAAIAAAFEAGKISIEVRDHAIARLDADLRAAGEQQAQGDRTNLETAIKALREDAFLSWERLPASLKQSLDAAGLLETVRDYQRAGKQFTNDEQAVAFYRSLPDEVLRQLPPGPLYIAMRKRMDDGALERNWARYQAVRGQADQKQLQLLSDLDTVKVWARSTLGWTGDLDEDQKAQLDYIVSKVQRRARDAGLREGDVQGLEALLKREEQNLLLVDGEARPAILLSKDEDAEAGARVPGGDVVPLVRVPGDFQTGVRALVDEWNRRNPGREIPVDDARVIGIWNAAGRPKTPEEVHRALYQAGELKLDVRASVEEPKSFEELYPEVSYPTTTELLQTGRLTIENLTKPR